MWLFRATGNESCLDILSSGNNGGVRSMFSWDDKFFGVQLLVSKNDNPWAAYKENVDMFVCSVLQKARDTNVRMSPGGMLWFQPWGNTQYITSSMLVLSVYADYLEAAEATLECLGGNVGPKDLISFVTSLVDYILDANLFVIDTITTLSDGKENLLLL
ncbi:endoglucanase 13-like [Musa acuminata AAA Group]|uniref:endoglucanase 13-like n=1 Tax=Musa acuminata AAA Group TaxID=214697 RepID=UPI0031D1B9FE